MLLTIEIDRQENTVKVWENGVLVVLAEGLLPEQETCVHGETGAHKIVHYPATDHWVENCAGP